MAKEDIENDVAPLEQFIGPEEFTNRKQELDLLWSLAEKATQHVATSYAILARKGLGKTTLMLEFYRQAFTSRKKVVPFYVSFAEYRHKPDVVQLTLEKFASTLFVNFAFQYGAFKSGKFSTPLRLPQLLSEQKKFFASLGDPNLEKEFLSHLHALENNDIEGAVEHAIDFASVMTSRRGEAGIVMIDEFQVLTQVYDKRSEIFRDLTERLLKSAEARWCPLVASSSEISRFNKIVTGRLASSQLGTHFMQPFEPQHTLDYVYRLSRRQQIKTSETTAMSIHQLTGGNPYYIWCMLNSPALKDKSLLYIDELEEVFLFETSDRRGRIWQYWDNHFKNFEDKINDGGIGLLVLHQLAVAQKGASAEAIAAALELPPEKVRQALKNLEDADLVERQSRALYHFIDRLLPVYIERHDNGNGFAGK